MNSPVEAVTFDAAGTLFRTAEPVGATYSRIARTCDLESDPEIIEAEFRSLFESLPPPHESRVDQAAPADGEAAERLWWKDLVRRVFQDGCEGETGPLPDQLFETLFSHYAQPEAWQLIPGVTGILGALRGRLKIGVISNFDRRFYEIARGLGILEFFDFVVLSSEARASKPDPRIFEMAARKSGIPADRILHVGDDPVRDIEGALRCGFRAVLTDSGPGFESEFLCRFGLGE